MGFFDELKIFDELKKMAKAVNEAMRPKTIIDHVQERISELEKEAESGKRFVSIRKIWNWMKENERMRLCNYDRLNERLQEELEKIDREKKAEDNYDVLGREFPSEDERKEAGNSAEKVKESIKKVRESVKKVEDALDEEAGLLEDEDLAEESLNEDKEETEKNAGEVQGTAGLKDKVQEPMEKDVHYFGEAYLAGQYERLPEQNSVVVVRRESDGVWLASTVEEVDAENRRVRCGNVWHSEFLPYRLNEELVGTTLKPKNPRDLRWGLKVWVKDDLKDEAEEAIFLGFNPEGESDMRWLTLSSAKMTLEAFACSKWPSFGHWKYMRVAED